MDTAEIKRTIVANAEKIRELQGGVHHTFRSRDESAAKREKWKEACSMFHASYDKLAFPGGYRMDANSNALQRILAGDQQAMEAAICFLELRPYFFRSGYMFWDILRKSKKAPLSAEQSDRLNIVLTNVAEWRLRKREAVSCKG